MKIRAPALTDPQRLAAAAACALAAVCLYLEASARAFVFDHYNLAPQLLHPWEHPWPTLFILALCRASWGAAFPLLKRGAVRRRISAISVLVLPVCMVAHFVYVAGHAGLWAFRELTTS